MGPRETEDVIQKVVNGKYSPRTTEVPGYCWKGRFYESLLETDQRGIFISNKLQMT